MKFKGEGRLCGSMGQVLAEFVNGEINTEDEDTVRFLLGKGYIAVQEASRATTKKGVTDGV